METERRRSHRRERRPLEPSSQPEQPLDPMPSYQTSDATAPSLDTKTAIARSMSRYKRTRPKPSRSISTPSIPSLPPIESSAGTWAATKERPTTTFDRFRHPGVGEDGDDDTPVPTSRKTSGIRPPQSEIQSPEALKNPKLGHHAQGSSHRKANSYELHGTRTVRPRKDSLQSRHPDSSRVQGNGSRYTRADGEAARRDAVTVEHGSRRNALPIRPAMVQKKSFSQRIAGLVSQPQSAAEAKEQLKSIISNPIAIVPEMSLPSPQFDAPKSAVNAGERTVRVKYKEFLVPVTVIPSTTPADVIRSVSDKVATPLDQDSSVLLESFKQLGLERPLRKYEHIRDVLNSWDNDAQNTLIIEPSSTGGHDDDLDVKRVPTKQPDDISFYLYHSQRPGHWDKRVVMVRSDGQILVAKSDGGEFSNICHLSDFDIYVPTVREVAKNIRPPKRICFAVKSQQKSSMFLTTVNFVHFFASNDKRMAMSLYTAVQEWRSWYLVNKMGKGIEHSNQPTSGVQRQGVKPLNKDIKEANPAHPSQRADESQRVHSAPSKPSMESSRRPAMQKAQHSAPQDVHPAYRSNNVHNKDRDDRQAPLPAPTKQSPIKPPPEEPFTGGGLLGRTYTQRKKAQHDHEQQLRPSDSLPIHTPISSPPAIKTDLKRTSSQRQKPKPLVDLTPVYQEPPQHSRKGRGVTPGQIPAGGLVDIATSPEVAIPIPPKNDWRRPPGMGPGAEVSPTRGY